ACVRLGSVGSAQVLPIEQSLNPTAQEKIVLHENIVDPRPEPPAPITISPVPAYCKEMGCTPAEFARQLPRLASSHKMTFNERRGLATITDGQHMVALDFERLPDRRLGSLTLPATKVNIRFRGYSAAEARTFIARFDRTFLRMGG
ncbi:MAG: hypothetical protein ACR2O4_15955, partial [Hyphomicrobiaceae bacterium]